MPRGIIRDPSPPPYPSLLFSLPMGTRIEGPVQTIQDSLRQSLDAQCVAIADTDGVLGPRLAIEFQPSDNRNMDDIPDDVWNEDWYSQTPNSVFTLNTRSKQILNTFANVRINGTLEPKVSVISMGPTDIVTISNNPNRNDGRPQRSLKTFKYDAFMLEKPNGDRKMAFSRRDFAKEGSINIEDACWFDVSAYKGHAVGGGVARYFGFDDPDEVGAGEIGPSDVEDEDGEEDEEEDDEAESSESDEYMKDDSDRSKSD